MDASRLAQWHVSLIANHLGQEITVLLSRVGLGVGHDECGWASLQNVSIIEGACSILEKKDSSTQHVTERKESADYLKAYIVQENKIGRSSDTR